jgi:rhodanese-related sulfurtransferase
MPCRRGRRGTSCVCPYRQRVLARIEGSKLIPMGELAERVSELDPARETVVICHHGSRSAYVARALQRAGFTKVLNLEGGVDAYSDVDGLVPRY